VASSATERLRAPRPPSGEGCAFARATGRLAKTALTWRWSPASPRRCGPCRTRPP